MTIRIETEQLVSLSEAAKLLPKRRNGKRPHISCLYRWTTVGLQGVVLESIQIGGTRCTRIEALSRFFTRLRPDISSEPLRTPSDRRRAIEAAERLLEAHGA
ncbi:MAG TPA: hypothetical protein DCQ98_19815 [Planctomycetaceae bacterium]|nr:hypothetical protein [Planctomycetaceae bacterium]